MLTQLEDWLYEDGMDADKATYEKKYNDLMEKCDPLVMREREASLRPDAIADLKKVVGRYADFVASPEERYAHISPEDKAKVAAEIQAVKDWLADIEAKVASSPTAADPIIKAAEIAAKIGALDSVCDPIMRKPKPAPKVEPAPAKEEPPESPAAEPAADGAAAEEKKPAGADMDID